MFQSSEHPSTWIKIIITFSYYFSFFCQVSFVSGNVLVLHCNTDGIEDDTWFQVKLNVKNQNWNVFVSRRGPCKFPWYFYMIQYWLLLAIGCPLQTCILHCTFFWLNYVMQTHVCKYQCWILIWIDEYLIGPRDRKHYLSRNKISSIVCISDS